MPTRTRSVQAVIRASRVIASPVGPGGRRWPPCQTDSMGSRSAAASQSRSGSGSAAAPKMMRSPVNASSSGRSSRGGSSRGGSSSARRSSRGRRERRGRLAARHEDSKCSLFRVEVVSWTRPPGYRRPSPRRPRRSGPPRGRAAWSWSAARPAAPSRSRRAGCAARAGAGTMGFARGHRPGGRLQLHGELPALAARTSRCRTPSCWSSSPSTRGCGWPDGCAAARRSEAAIGMAVEVGFEPGPGGFAIPSFVAPSAGPG